MAKSDEESGVVPVVAVDTESFSCSSSEALVASSAVPVAKSDKESAVVVVAVPDGGRWDAAHRPPRAEPDRLTSSP